jgi:hypothetical protein
MATLALTAQRDVLLGLPGNAPVALSIVRASAEPNDDGTWSVTGYAAEDQIPALEALGCTVQVVTSDATLLARWQEIQIDDDPPVA